MHWSTVDIGPSTTQVKTRSFPCYACNRLRDFKPHRTNTSPIAPPCSHCPIRKPTCVYTHNTTEARGVNNTMISRPMANLYTYLNCRLRAVTKCVIHKSSTCIFTLSKLQKIQTCMYNLFNEIGSNVEHLPLTCNFTITLMLDYIRFQDFYMGSPWSGLQDLYVWSKHYFLKF